MEGWLTRIATNTCLNILRTAKRRPELTVSDLTDDENNWLDQKLSDVGRERHRSAERQLVAADLADRLLGTLSTEDRLTLTLIDGEDASVREVSEMTGWSASKVKVRAFRARQRAREALEKLLGGKLLGHSGAKTGLDLSENESTGE
jgi:RNA polymerase sigma-70 factor, ECF subfamily